MGGVWPEGCGSRPLSSQRTGLKGVAVGTVGWGDIFKKFGGCNIKGPVLNEFDLLFTKGKLQCPEGCQGHQWRTPSSELLAHSICTWPNEITSLGTCLKCTSRAHILAPFLFCRIIQEYSLSLGYCSTWIRSRVSSTLCAPRDHHVWSLGAHKEVKCEIMSEPRRKSFILCRREFLLFVRFPAMDLEI